MHKATDRSAHDIRRTRGTWIEIAIAPVTYITSLSLQSKLPLTQFRGGHIGEIKRS